MCCAEKAAYAIVGRLLLSGILDTQLNELGFGESTYAAVATHWSGDRRQTLTQRSSHKPTLQMSNEISQDGETRKE
jgi:hypothetical protein